MEFFNFSSVELLPNAKASAAFTVDSGKVFREDTNIAPVVIDKSLSYIPWGADNQMTVTADVPSAVIEYQGLRPERIHGVNFVFLLAAWHSSSKLDSALARCVGCQIQGDENITI